jgi:hypothetical protein
MAKWTDTFACSKCGSYNACDCDEKGEGGGSADSDDGSSLFAMIVATIAGLIIIVILCWGGAKNSAEPSEKQLQSKRHENVHYIPAYTGDPKANKR